MDMLPTLRYLSERVTKSCWHLSQFYVNTIKTSSWQSKNYALLPLDEDVWEYTNIFMTSDEAMDWMDSKEVDIMSNSSQFTVFTP